MVGSNVADFFVDSGAEDTVVVVLKKSNLVELRLASYPPKFINHKPGLTVDLRPWGGDPGVIGLKLTADVPTAVKIHWSARTQIKDEYGNPKWWPSLPDPGEPGQDKNWIKPWVMLAPSDDPVVFTILAPSVDDGYAEPDPPTGMINDGGNPPDIYEYYHYDYDYDYDGSPGTGDITGITFSNGGTDSFDLEVTGDTILRRIVFTE
jgi:hypothetical protein